MIEGTFKAFRKKYEDRLDEDEVIKFLLNDKIRNYIIENDDYDFLASIASANNDELRIFYFNEQTIPYIVQCDKFSQVLYRSNFYPNKIKLLDNVVFLSFLTLKHNTRNAVEHITKEIKEQRNNLELVNTLKDGLYKLMDYLQLDFSNNIKHISVFMEQLPEEIYKEFLDYILDNLKHTTYKNKELQFDKIFKNDFIKYDSTFGNLEIIINKFKGINNLYYSPSLLYNLIDKSVDYNNNLKISEQELKRLKGYIFNDYCKQIFLRELDYFTLKKLYVCFSNEIIDFLLDDDGLIILENNNKFDKLLSNDIPYDKLTKSKLFAMLLSKNYTNEQYYDKKINCIGKSFSSNISFYNLLDKYIELEDYTHFFRIFKILTGDIQLLYFNNNSEKLFKINNPEIYKGAKKEVYNLFKTKLNIKNWIFSDYDLLSILKNKDSYSLEQIEYIFSNKENAFAIINGNYIKYTYELLLNLNISKINQIYMSEEILSFLRNSNNLNKVYGIIENLEVDVSQLLLNINCLIDIGEKVADKYKKSKIDIFDKLPNIKLCTNYCYFLLYIPRLKNINTLFKILDFYLTNPKYLSTFFILRSGLKEEVLQEYLNSRKELITKIIQENKCDLSLILGELPDKLRKNEFFKERENIALHLSTSDYFSLFRDDFNGKYRLDKKTINDENFIRKFIGCYNTNTAEKALKLITDDEELIQKIFSKIKLYIDMKKKIINNLNDSIDEFMTYLKILINSGINVFEIEFLKDMIDVIFNNKRIKEVYIKYENINLEKIKLEILSNVIKFSRENIAASITNPLENKVVYTEYMLDNEKVLIPTIIYDKETYTFLVRRMDSGQHFYDGTYKDGLECYSTITDKNRSMFYGNTGIKFGYIRVIPEDIIQVNSFDAISQSSNSNKYISPYIKYPEWVSMEELNKRTLENKSYNEIRIKGKYIPDFVVSYDEPNEKTLRYSHEHSTPMVKILRKNYPNAVEECEDPYSHWQ